MEQHTEPSVVLQPQTTTITEALLPLQPFPLQILAITQLLLEEQLTRTTTAPRIGLSMELQTAWAAKLLLPAQEVALPA